MKGKNTKRSVKRMIERKEIQKKKRKNVNEKKKCGKRVECKEI